VVDNDGGGIFSTLPQKDVEGFEKIFGTPHGLSIGRILDAFKISYDVVYSAKALHKLLKVARTGFHVIVIKVPSRKENAEFLQNALLNYQRLIQSTK
jgi:2-succinyl-5-enolpyruvyl-6-hydroxy-3-cyclohexene-1-carboxylate synthase